jgi:hypothetical protein
MLPATSPEVLEAVGVEQRLAELAPVFAPTALDRRVGDFRFVPEEPATSATAGSFCLGASSAVASVAEPGLTATGPSS